MSDKTIAQKILIKPNYSVLLVSPPNGYAATLGGLPANVTIQTEPNGQSDLIQLFVVSMEELQTQLERMKHFLKPGGLLWVTYPQGSSRMKVDINRDIIREYAKTVGMEGVSLVAIDDNWTALRLKVI